MAYEKPEVLAQNDKQGSFAAGCPPQRQDAHYVESMRILV